ncbi:MAG: isoprenylcysteine carboxylmethyltransferase family protein [Candidatus Diapherotrites archaeon]|nr:isoprenylcysteine carboxylmethyltransferase family protein [Candidatus Diapherotrites archaeon]
MQTRLLLKAIIGIIILTAITAFFDSPPYLRTLLSFAVFLVPAAYIVAQNSEKKAETKERHALDFKVYSRVFSPIFTIFLIIIFFELWTRKLDLTISIAGVILLFTGLVIYVKSVLTLGKFFSKELEIKKGHALVTSGIYTHVRHPSYAGSFLLFLGFALIANSAIAIALFLIVMVPWLAWRINNEEKFLEKKFGREFVEYKKNSKLLIPKIF